MKKIGNLVYLNNARNAEHYNLYLQVLNIVTDDFATKYKVSALRNALAVAFANEDEAYLQSQAFENTKEIDEKDAVRDQRLRYINLTVQTKELSMVDAEVNAAKKLAFALAPYSNAASRPFAENTAMVEDLVRKLQSDAYASYVQALGLTESVATLKTANDEFVAVFSLRADEKRLRTVNDNLKKLRPAVDDAARKLFDALNALFLVNELVQKDQEVTTELGGVIDAINAQIVVFAETLSRRGVGKKAKIEPDDKPVVDDPTPPDSGDDDHPVIE